MEFLKLLRCSTSNSIHIITRRLDFFFIALHKEIKRKNRRVSNNVCIGILVRGPPLIDKHWSINFSQTLQNMSIFNNIYQSYVCDPLGLYILLFDNSIDPTTLISQLYQLTISPYTLTNLGSI